MAMWNPWYGCKKYSEGCLHCYISKGALKHGYDFNNIYKSNEFYKPIEKYENGNYKIKSGLVYLCFSSDFLLPEADIWREECFKMIKERNDLTFLFLTKRIDRFLDCIPEDWGSGYDNVIVCTTVENQKNADYRLKIFKDLPIKHKCITAQPLLEKITLSEYLDGIELVVVGGESDKDARVFDYEWALSIRDECIKNDVSFEFRQCGSKTIKDGIIYNVNPYYLAKWAREANINYKSVKNA